MAIGLTVGAPKPIGLDISPASLAMADQVQSGQPNTPYSAPKPIGFVKDQTNPYQPQAEKVTAGQRMGAAAVGGLQAAGNVQPTTDATSAAVSVLGSAAAGAATGTAVLPGYGTAIGAGVGAVIGGLNAWMGVKAARSERNRQAALKAETTRLNAESIARDEKWRQIYRLDSLEQARYDRKKYAMQSAYEATQAQGKNLMAIVNANQSLRDSWVKKGYL